MSDSRNCLRNVESGQGLAEYIIIAILVAIAALAAVRLLGRSVRCQYGQAVYEMGSSTSLENCEITGSGSSSSEPTPTPTLFFTPTPAPTPTPTCLPEGAPCGPGGSQCAAQCCAHGAACTFIAGGGETDCTCAGTFTGWITTP